LAGRLIGTATPFGVAARAFSRIHDELVEAAVAAPADLVYGGTTGGLAATREAAERLRVPYGVDLEDFYLGEFDADERLGRRLTAIVERQVLRRARFLTAASAPIADAYVRAYGVSPVTIHNTFPLPVTAPDPEPSAGPGLRLYWFSQTIGPGRGLEDAVAAMGLARIPGELHLRGRAISEYLEGLRRFAAKSAPGLRVVQHDPAPPDAMVDLCRGYDVGLALEQAVVLNSSLCLSNKAFTYVLAGLAVALTDTLGHRALAEDLGEGALVYQPGDVATLSAGLGRWANNKALLARAMAAGWEAAKRRWHWEHPLERGALLEATASALAA
jgi:hypothetical protein